MMDVVILICGLPLTIPLGSKRVKTKASTNSSSGTPSRDGSNPVGRPGTFPIEVRDGRAHLLDPTNTDVQRGVLWCHPAYANRSIYWRNDKEIACWSFGKE